MGVDPGPLAPLLRSRRLPTSHFCSPSPTPLPPCCPVGCQGPPSSSSSPPKAHDSTAERPLPSPPQGLIPHPASSPLSPQLCVLPADACVSFSLKCEHQERGHTVSGVHCLCQGHTHPLLPPRVQLPMDGEPPGESIPLRDAFCLQTKRHRIHVELELRAQATTQSLIPLSTW